MSGLTQHPYARIGAALAWALLIFLQSASATTAKLVPMPFEHFDKVAHLLIYAVLGALIYRAGKQDWLQARSAAWAFSAFGLGCLYGASDEWHQSFVAGRSASWSDWCFDLLGVGLGVLCWVFWRRQITRVKKEVL